MPDLATLSHLSPMLSSFLVDGVGTLGFLALAGAAFARSVSKSAEARAADASAEEPAPLAVGDIVLFGTVEYARDENVAVRVEVDQHGEESESSGVWSHKWTETKRRVLVAPFYLKLSSGERVRVEPSADVLLVDSMDGKIRVDLTHRIRSAELTPGETVFAAGTLVRAVDPESAAGGGGYRSPGEGFVLRPPRSGKMLLSSEPLGNRFRERSRFHRSWFFYILITAAVFHVAFLGYHVRRYWGETTTATIRKLDHSITKDDDGDDVHHYVVWLEPKGGGRFSDNVSDDLYSLLREGDGVPVRYVRHKAFAELSSIGRGGTVFGFAWCVVPLFLATWLLYRGKESLTRPWYERELVDDGSGRLGDTLHAERNRQEQA